MIVNQNNVYFLESLFRYEDVRKYYVLRDDHARDIRKYCKDIIEANIQGFSLNYVIYDNFGSEVGIISAEPVMNNKTNMPIWNVGYAIHPSSRNKGYATEALNELTNYLLNNFSFQQVMLDISDDNKASQKVAKKCGFIKPNDRTGYFDMEHPEVGMRFRWFKQLAGQRTIYFNQATHYYRQRMYNESVKAFEAALSEPYQAGTPLQMHKYTQTWVWHIHH
jgi:predicted acetyltransferase